MYMVVFAGVLFTVTVDAGNGYQVVVEMLVCNYRAGDLE
jgi:hypothetical protein